MGWEESSKPSFLSQTETVTVCGVGVLLLHVRGREDVALSVTCSQLLC